MLIIDNFLSSFYELKMHSVDCIFGDIVNPVDGVVYPHINLDIPAKVLHETKEKIEQVFGDVNINYAFLRMSPKGVFAPQAVHTDCSMGKYSLMLYLNSADGGTAMMAHKASGISQAPTDEFYLGVTAQDKNNIGAWEIIDMANMKENRAVIFDAKKYHCAMPVGGFGETQADSRIVMTVFFND
jgi:hypothetical protein